MPGRKRERVVRISPVLTAVKRKTATVLTCLRAHVGGGDGDSRKRLDDCKKKRANTHPKGKRCVFSSLAVSKKPCGI